MRRLTKPGCICEKTFETSRGCAHMSSMGSGCLLALGLLASLCGGARGVLLSAASRGAGAHMSAALLERAPPAPPPATSGGRGRGGDGDSESEFLRLLSQQEMSSLLSDWASRAKIYKMSNNVVVQDRQAVCIDVIEKMEAHGKRITPGKKQLSIGLFDAERLWAMSCAEVSAAEGLVVHWLVVNPQELNDESSTAALRLLHGMHVLAEAIDLPLDLKPLKSKGMVEIAGILTLDSDSSYGGLGQ